jgi:hypothetical protein
LNKNQEQFERDLKKLEPQQRVMILEKMLVYAIPKMQSVEAKIMLLNALKRCCFVQSDVDFLRKGYIDTTIEQNDLMFNNLDDRVMELWCIAIKEMHEVRYKRLYENK